MKIKWIIIWVICLVIGICTAFFIINTNEKYEKIVVIANGNIKNEDLIDEFTEKIGNELKEEIELNIKLDNKSIKIVFTPGQNMINYDENAVSQVVYADDGSFESQKLLNGYYSLYIDNELSREFPLYTWHIDRTATDDTVTLKFAGKLYYDSEEDNVIICSYNLSSSNYDKKFELIFTPASDLTINEIYDNGEYKLKTFGGDVNVITNANNVYSLKDAIEQKVITCDDILNQVEMDVEYGICNVDMYLDGGSKEYTYSDYTVLKLNAIHYEADTEKDLVIGIPGHFLSEYNKMK